MTFVNLVTRSSITRAEWSEVVVFGRNSPNSSLYSIGLYYLFVKFETHIFELKFSKFYSIAFQYRPIVHNRLSVSLFSIRSRNNTCFRPTVQFMPAIYNVQAICHMAYSIHCHYELASACSLILSRIKYGTWKSVIEFWQFSKSRLKTSMLLW